VCVRVRNFGTGGCLQRHGVAPVAREERVLDQRRRLVRQPEIARLRVPFSGYRFVFVSIRAINNRVHAEETIRKKRKLRYV
jgi:hypothetical protein